MLQQGCPQELIEERHWTSRRGIKVIHNPCHSGSKYETVPGKTDYFVIISDFNIFGSTLKRAIHSIQ